MPHEQSEAGLPRGGDGPPRSARRCRAPAPPGSRAHAPAARKALRTCRPPSQHERGPSSARRGPSGGSRRTIVRVLDAQRGGFGAGEADHLAAFGIDRGDHARTGACACSRPPAAPSGAMSVVEALYADPAECRGRARPTPSERASRDRDRIGGSPRDSTRRRAPRRRELQDPLALERSLLLAQRGPAMRRMTSTNRVPDATRRRRGSRRRRHAPRG